MAFHSRLTSTFRGTTGSCSEPPCWYRSSANLYSSSFVRRLSSRHFDGILDKSDIGQQVVKRQSNVGQCQPALPVRLAQVRDDARMDAPCPRGSLLRSAWNVLKGKRFTPARHSAAFGSLLQLLRAWPGRVESLERQGDPLVGNLAAAQA